MTKYVYLCYVVSFWLYKKRVPLIPVIINRVFIRVIAGCQIGLGATIGRNVIFGYGGLGVVIHHKSVIRDNVNIGTGVTIGGTTNKVGVPTIGENTIISTGCKIIGPVSIGKNCVIGANSVVLSDVPDNCVVVGSPAKVVKTDIDIYDYKNNVK